MSRFATAVLAAEKISTKAEKHAALSGITGPELRLISETFNPYRVFNVRQFADPVAYASTDDSLDHFFRLLDLLADRRLTGTAARTAVTATLGMYTERTASVLKRVLLKDLDCGANRSTFEKIYPLLNIPKFDLALASKIEDADDFEWKFPTLAEFKYDGMRLVAIVANGDVTYLSRSGKPSDYCDGLFDAELIQMERYVGVPIVVDGECLGSNFQDTAQAKGSGGNKANLRFYAFDFMKLSEWQAQHCPQTQIERSQNLERIIKHLGLTSIIKSGYKLCNTYQEVKDFFKSVVKAGYEGLICKDPDALYIWDRSPAWMKWKPVSTFDGVVIDVMEGKGRLKGTCGKVRVRGIDENGRKFEGNVGSGFDDKSRAWFWKHRNEICGNLVIEFEAQELSQAQNKTGTDVWSMRFGVFIKPRFDRCSIVKALETEYNRTVSNSNPNFLGDMN